MTLIEDVRQKSDKHNNIHRYCQDNNIEIVPMVLNVGDYMFPNGKVSVDTKQSLLELANDLYHDKLAFNKKYKKSLHDGIKLAVLVEEEINSLSDLVKWRSKHSKITGRYLLEMIETVKRSFGVEFYFCNKENTGENIIRILKGEAMKPKKDDRVVVEDEFGSIYMGRVENISTARRENRKYAVEVMTHYNPHKIIFVGEKQIKEILKNKKEIYYGV